MIVARSTGLGDDARRADETDGHRDDEIAAGDRHPGGQPPVDEATGCRPPIGGREWASSHATHRRWHPTSRAPDESGRGRNGLGRPASLAVAARHQAGT